MKIFIRPLDTLFFRDGKPFTAGEDTSANVVFPPFPQTLYNAIRSKIIAESHDRLNEFLQEKNPQLKNEFGSPNSLGTLTVNGPFLARLNTDGRLDIFLPVPSDILKNKESGNLIQLVLKKRDQLPFDLGDEFRAQFVLFNSTPYEGKGTEGFWTVSQIKRYLSTEIEASQDGEIKEPFTNVNAIFKKEPHTGIKISKASKTSEVGFIYRYEMIRMEEGYGFYAEIEGLSQYSLPNKGFLKLGGEGRACEYFTLETDSSFSLLKNTKWDSSPNHFKLYLATPAIFEKGWLPDWIDEDTLEGVRDNIKLRLIGASISSFINVSGWDMVKRYPKKGRKAVPSGSVYYFEILEGNAEDIVRVFHGKSISDNQEGWGRCFTGGLRI